MKHPITGQQMEWKAGVPDSFLAALEQLGLPKKELKL
jgi:hypothetical protein